MVQAGWRERRVPIIRFRSSLDAPDVQNPDFSDCIVPLIWCDQTPVFLFPGRLLLSVSQQQPQLMPWRRHASDCNSYWQIWCMPSPSASITLASQWSAALLRGQMLYSRPAYPRSNMMGIPDHSSGLVGCGSPEIAVCRSSCILYLACAAAIVWH